MFGFGDLVAEECILQILNEDGADGARGSNGSPGSSGGFGGGNGGNLKVNSVSYHMVHPGPGARGGDGHHGGNGGNITLTLIVDGDRIHGKCQERDVDKLFLLSDGDANKIELSSRGGSGGKGGSGGNGGHGATGTPGRDATRYSNGTSGGPGVCVRE